MNRLLLSDAMIAREREKPPLPGATRFLWDRRVAGLAVRLHPSGGATFMLQYRTRTGLQRRMRLGPVGVVPLDQAREQAARLLADAHQGRDPVSARRREKEQRENDPAADPFRVENVVAEFIKRYLEEGERTASYIRDSKSRFRRFVLPAWRGRDVRSITRREIVTLVDGIVDARIPIQARRMASQIGTFFNWAFDRGLIETNPAARMKKPGAEHRRTRVLSDSELAAVWHGASALSAPWGEWFKVLLLTGQRRTETARMQWADVRWADAEWRLSAIQTKSGRAHIVPLSTAALDVLALLATNTPCVFTTRDGVPICNYNSGKRLLDRQLGGQVAPFGIHDLRRTCATGMAKLGVAPHVIAAILNHAPQGVTAQVYNLHPYETEKRAALELWSRHVAEVAG
jgi:integrase